MGRRCGPDQVPTVGSLTLLRPAYRRRRIPALTAVQQKAGNVNNFGKNLALWIIIGVLLVALLNLFQGSTPRSSQSSLPYSDFLSEVEAGRVNQVTLQGKPINGHFSHGRPFDRRRTRLNSSH